MPGLKQETDIYAGTALIENVLKDSRHLLHSYSLQAKPFWPEAPLPPKIKEPIPLKSTEASISPLLPLHRQRRHLAHMLRSGQKE